MWTGPNDAPLSSKEERMQRLPTLWTVTATKEPEIVGYIVVAGDSWFPVYKRPNVFHMLMMHLFFGWEYQPVQE